MPEAGTAMERKEQCTTAASSYGTLPYALFGQIKPCYPHLFLQAVIHQIKMILHEGHHIAGQQRP